MHLRRKVFYILVLIVGFSWACGFQDAEYVPYDSESNRSKQQTDATTDPSTGTADETSGGSCDEVALQAFTRVQGTIASICSGCHNPTGTASGSGLLLDGDAATNRTTLHGWIKGNGDLWAYISSGSHGGGNQGQALPKSAIDTWLASEVCE